MQLVVQYLTKNANVCEKKITSFCQAIKRMYDIGSFFCLAVYVVNPNAGKHLNWAILGGGPLPPPGTPAVI